LAISSRPPQRAVHCPRFRLLCRQAGRSAAVAVPVKSLSTKRGLSAGAEMMGSLRGLPNLSSATEPIETGAGLGPEPRGRAATGAGRVASQAAVWNVSGKGGHV
jgi:hypothetical protein